MCIRLVLNDFSSNNAGCLFESRLKNKADAAQNEQGVRARKPP
jgi:hypothetical protein